MNLMKDLVAFVGKSGQVKVLVEWMGEGWDGDYDGNNPNDVPFLRFSVSKWHGDFWEAIDDSSYCTLLPATIDGDMAMEAAKQILSRVEATVLEGGSIKKICEKLSWIDITWLAEPQSDEEDIS